MSDQFKDVSESTYVVEWQKRNLPHAHILMVIRPETNDDDYSTANTIDKYISAEIPNPELHPQLHQIICNHNIHTPCGIINPSMNRHTTLLQRLQE